MGVTVELLMAADSELEALIKKPKSARAFIKSTWSSNTHESRSFGIKGIWSEVDYVLCEGKPSKQSPLGFLQADEVIVGKVKRVRRMKVHGETIEWNEYEGEKDFAYGPPSALRSQRVADIHQALAPVTDEWVRANYNADDLTPEFQRGQLTAADYDRRIQYCQEAVRDLKAFITRAADARMGLLRYSW